MRSYIFTDSEREQAEAEGEDLQVTCNKAFSGIGQRYMVDGVRTFLFTVRERKLGTW